MTFASLLEDIRSNWVEESSPLRNLNNKKFGETKILNQNIVKAY
jgi:hypothetical protein